ncbi:hypothetical protein O6P43_003707 [Quillaja saponaria]|uniref:Uncharacterized protein n=1 Tax=Quillaja saponaria TaxID=32244 RepID=A0AAD7QFB1_QUISA|nr:hypothetical protein O6P43_003707 [Quillaja saponaria]
MYGYIPGKQSPEQDGARIAKIFIQQKMVMNGLNNLPSLWIVAEDAYKFNMYILGRVHLFNLSESIEFELRYGWLS